MELINSTEHSGRARSWSWLCDPGYSLLQNSTLYKRATGPFVLLLASLKPIKSPPVVGRIPSIAFCLLARIKPLFLAPFTQTVAQMLRRRPVARDNLRVARWVSVCNLALFALLVFTQCTTFTTKPVTPVSTGASNCRVLSEYLQPAFVWGAVPLTKPRMELPAGEEIAYRMEQGYNGLDLLLSVAAGFVFSYHQSRTIVYRCDVEGSFLTNSQIQQKREEGKEQVRKERARAISAHLISMWNERFPEDTVSEPDEDGWFPPERTTQSGAETPQGDGRASDESESSLETSEGMPNPGVGNGQPGTQSSGSDRLENRDARLRVQIMDGTTHEGTLIRWNDEKLILLQASGSTQREVALSGIIALSWTTDPAMGVRN